MKRSIVSFACLGFATASVQVCAQAYPTKLVQIIVPFAAGSPPDIQARLVADKMAVDFKQPVIVDNRTGAAGGIGAGYVANAAPDGYTVLWTPDTVFTVNPLVYPKLPYDPAKDFVPVALTGRAANVLVVNATLKAQNLTELVTLAKSQRLTYSSAGSGSAGHLTMAYLLERAGVAMDHIGYKSAAAGGTAVISGEVNAGFLRIGGPTLGIIRAGKVRALAVSSRERWPGLPEFPTVAEAGYKDFDATFVYYVMVPTGTPQAVIESLYERTAAAMNAPDVRQKLAIIGIEPTVARGSEVTKHTSAYRAKWSPIVQQAQMRVN